MADLRTAAMVMLAMLTGYSGSPDVAAMGATIAGSAPIVGSQRSLRGVWPDPDVRAGLRPTAKIGVRARLPRTRPRGPRCAISTALAASLNRSRPDQVLLVTAAGTRARVAGCERVNAGYVRVLGPFSARVGRNGVAARGAKREGDGRTPAGVFTLDSGFGTAKNPGLAASFGWFTAGRADVWVDDPKSRLYNTHQSGPARGRWHSAEKLQITPYRTAQVIGYNLTRTAGRGSAIFLHLSTGRATAGCVSLSAAQLRAVMRWERADAVIAIG